MDLLRTAKKYKWVISLAAVAVFLFYWYEIRPVRLYRACARSSSSDARVLLKSKAQIAKGTDKGKAYEELIAKNMYLRSDYDSFLQKCLLNYGLTLPGRPDDVPAKPASSTPAKAAVSSVPAAPAPTPTPTPAR